MSMEKMKRTTLLAFFCLATSMATRIYSFQILSPISTKLYGLNSHSRRKENTSKVQQALEMFPQKRRNGCSSGSTVHVVTNAPGSNISTELDVTLSERIWRTTELIERNIIQHGDFLHQLEGNPKPGTGVLVSLRAGAQSSSSTESLSTNQPSTTFMRPYKLFLALALVLMCEVGARLTNNLPLALSTYLFSLSFWGSLAPFASIAMKLSPMPTILKVRKKKSVGGLPLLPYSAMASLTFVLFSYGFLERDPKVAITHGIGHVISLYYCIQYILCCPKDASHLPGTVKQHKVAFVSILSFVLGCVIFVKERASKVIGLFSVLLSCTMYIGPLTRLSESISNRSARDIPLPFALMGFVNALAWSLYGYFVRNDFVLYAPCFIGLLSTSAQILVNIVYGNGEKLKEA